MPSRYELIGSGSGARPVPRKLGYPTRAICEESGTWINSALRTQRAVTWARKRGADLSSQAELYYGYVAGLPGYNPANRPGQSTHERRSDGIAYAIAVGLPLRWWQCGLDIGGPRSSRENAQAFCEAARRHNWIASITYPSSPNEQHHVNFRKMPKYRKPINLERGDRGRKVEKYSRRLAFLRRPNSKHRYFNDRTRDFTRKLEASVKAFQRDHDMAVDGVIGPHTADQIDTSFRHQWKKRGKRA